MPYLLAIAAGALTALLRGGRLSALAEQRFHSSWLAAAGATLWLVTDYPRLQTALRLSGAAPLLLFLGHLLLLFFIWRNRRTPWLLLVGFGLFLNLLVMAANGGQMPFDEALLRAAGGYEKTEALRAQGVWLHFRPATAETHLPFLGDTIYIGPPFPSPTILSPGDLVIAAGAFLVVHAALLPSASPGRHRARAAR